MHDSRSATKVTALPPTANARVTVPLEQDYADAGYLETLMILWKLLMAEREGFEPSVEL